MKLARIILQLRNYLYKAEGFICLFVCCFFLFFFFFVFFSFTAHSTLFRLFLSRSIYITALPVLAYT